MAKQVALTGHDAALVKTWKVTALALNGVAKPISYLSGSLTYPDFGRTFFGAGTTQRYRLQGFKILLPQFGSQNWVSGGGLVNYQGGLRQASIYSITAGVLSLWQLDGAGNTLKLTLKPFGAPGNHAAFVGRWHPVSVKENGSTVALKDFFGWETGVDSMSIQFYADGTAENDQRQALALKRAELVKWSTSGSNVTMVFAHGPTTMAYVATATTVTLDWTEDGKTKHAVFNKG